MGKSKFKKSRKLNEKKGAAEFTGPMSLLKDSLSRARKVNQFTNSLWRHLIKPPLPSKYCELADVADESAF